MDNINRDKIDKVKITCKLVDDTVDLIVNNLTNELDNLMKSTKSKIFNNEMTDELLESIIIRIPTELYFINTELERVILKETIAKEYSREKYNNEMRLAEGTVALKSSIAEQKSQEERLIENMYKTAKARIEGKIENANNLLNSCKKILSKRISEREMQ